MEERVGVAELTLGVNSYRELCSLHFDYLTKTTVEDVISTVSDHAANYATKLVQQIKEAVIKDVQSRYNFALETISYLSYQFIVCQFNFKIRFILYNIKFIVNNPNLIFMDLYNSIIVSIYRIY